MAWAANDGRSSVGSRSVRELIFGVVVSDSETHELGHTGHRAVEELVVTKGELNGSGLMRTCIQAPLGLIEER